MKTLSILLLVTLCISIVLVFYVIRNQAPEQLNLSAPFMRSTKNNLTNVRSGPSLDYPILWKYTKTNVPIRVIDIYNNWYQIEDFSGARGWILKGLTSKEPMAITINATKIFATNQRAAKILAEIEQKNIVRIISCNHYIFCKISIEDPINKGTITGWVQQTHLWGIAP